jgi:hypothetical protein
VQYTSNFERTICPTENTTESRSSIMNTSQNVVGKRNTYQSNNRSRLPEPTPASLVSGVQYTISIKDSEGSMLVGANASTVYTV